MDRFVPARSTSNPLNNLLDGAKYDLGSQNAGYHSTSSSSSSSASTTTGSGTALDSWVAAAATRADIPTTATGGGIGGNATRMMNPATDGSTTGATAWVSGASPSIRRLHGQLLQRELLGGEEEEEEGGRGGGDYSSSSSSHNTSIRSTTTSSSSSSSFPSLRGGRTRGHASTNNNDVSHYAAILAAASAAAASELAPPDIYSSYGDDDEEDRRHQYQQQAQAAVAAAAAAAAVANGTSAAIAAASTATSSRTILSTAATAAAMIRFQQQQRQHASGSSRGGSGGGGGRIGEEGGGGGFSGSGILLSRGGGGAYGENDDPAGGGSVVVGGGGRSATLTTSSSSILATDAALDASFQAAGGRPFAAPIPGSPGSAIAALRPRLLRFQSSSSILGGGNSGNNGSASTTTTNTTTSNRSLDAVRSLGLSPLRSHHQQRSSIDFNTNSENDYYSASSASPGGGGGGGAFPLSSPGRRSGGTASSSMKTTRHVGKVPYKVLDAPALADDFYLNLLDWSSQNVLVVGLGADVYMWNAYTAKVTKLANIGTDDAVTSVSWTQKGGHVAIGTDKGTVQLWDAVEGRLVRTMSGHTARVGSLSWAAHSLATGGRDKTICIRDVRSPNQMEHRLTAHKQEVCGLRWSPDWSQLASGGNDNRLLVWSAAQMSGGGGSSSNTSSSISTTTAPLMKFTQHTAAIKALAWSPHRAGLLASGGGTSDKCIRFFNTNTGVMEQVMDTGSQVCQLEWSPRLPELVSCHGYSTNSVTIWRYPTMSKVATLSGHTTRVLYMSMSPDGQSIVTGAGDETLRFWMVFPPPEYDGVDASASLLLPPVGGGREASRIGLGSPIMDVR